MTAQVSTFRFELAAGARRSIAVVGNTIRGMAGDAPYTIRLDDAPPTKLQTGVAYTLPGGFTNVEVHNTHAATQTIELVVAQGDVQDSRLVGNVDISGGIRLVSGVSASYGAVTVDTTAVLVAAANAQRSTLLIQNQGSANIAVGPDASVTTATGIVVAPGGSMSVTVGTAIYAISGSAGQDVRFLEESIE